MSQRAAPASRRVLAAGFPTISIGVRLGRVPASNPSTIWHSTSAMLVWNDQILGGALATVGKERALWLT